MASQQQREGSYPRVVQLLGRSAARENGDICGEYTLVGTNAGSAVYQKTGSTLAIYHLPSMGRWVIDREGVRESGVCVAFADDLSGLGHPAHAKIIWSIWDSKAQAHLPDPELMLSDAPAQLALVGRAQGLDHANVNGEYRLVEMRHGRPAYLQKGGSTMLRYHAPEDRWLISMAADGNVCMAYAEAQGTQHPGHVGLRWQFFEAQKRSWDVDPGVAATTAPPLVHVIGRSPEAENARICGSYRLAGAHDGRPVYMQPESQALIRYCAKHDWWLIDCDGCSEPSLSSKLYQWILRGDPDAAKDRCAAYCEARSSDHPGYSNLEWRVWESRTARHTLDLWVRATTAPLGVRVAGRAAARENGDITGEYFISGTHLGRPTYRKAGSNFALRYWAPMQRWLLDREGVRNLDTCVAYAAGPEGAEHPACGDFKWHVFETSRGCHLADPAVTVTPSPTAPRELPRATAAAPRSAAAAVAGKRPLGADAPGSLEAPKKVTRTGGRSWFAGLFGGA